MNKNETEKIHAELEKMINDSACDLEYVEEPFYNKSSYDICKYDKPCKYKGYIIDVTTDALCTFNYKFNKKINRLLK